MSHHSLKLDYAFCMDDVLGEGRGVSARRLLELAPRVAELHQNILKQKEEGKLGFMELPFMGPQDLNPILAEAERVKVMADTLVVLGIGGSALGATAVDMALSGALRLAQVPRPGAVRLLVADNPDPRVFGALLDSLDLSRTVFNVVSKSGSTAETMSQYMVARQMLEHQLGREGAVKRLSFTTDPVSGNLRKLAADEPVSVLTVPPNVGGRYSVLSAVGLMPLAAAGHDVKSLLAGAADMAELCRTPELAKNPAYLLAALAVEYASKGRNILVMMPYATDLFGLAQWFAQLWAESLGKAVDLAGNPAHVGQQPVAAVGATDQHSQLQLYMEGPQDKLVLFLTLDEYGRDLVIPDLHPEIEGLTYLGGRTMAELIKAEARATAAALASQGRPNLSLRLHKIGPRILGQVLFLLELATVMAGHMMNINPMDQPGVELGKKLTYGLMGRKGYDEFAGQVAAMEKGGQYRI